MKKIMILTASIALSAMAFAEIEEAKGEVRTESPVVDTTVFSERDVIECTPFQFNVATPLSLIRGSDYGVCGVKWNLFYGESRDVTGLDFGLVGVAAGAVRGLQLNAWNWVDENMCGLQIGLVGNNILHNTYGVQIGSLLNLDSGEFSGLQLGSFNFNDGMFGLQIGALNWNRNESSCWQFGAINANHNDFIGAAFGVYNWAENMHGGQIGVFNSTFGASVGFQIGVINAAEELDGVQIGVVNINAKAKLPVMVIANANF